MTGEPPPASPPPAPDRSLGYAIAVSLVLIAIAVLGAAGVSRLARPTPTPSASFLRPSPASPASAEPQATDSSAFVFTQPLSAGCAAGDAVYVVSDGGGIGRFAFDRWQLVDPIARSLVAATCQGDVLTAVGGGGRVVTINDREQTIRSDTVLFGDLLGVAPLGDGVLAVGRSGTVQRQGAGGWSVYANGIDEDLVAVAAFGPSSAWAVGAGGVSYRLEPAGWRPVPTDVTATLRAIAARAVDDAVVVGDDGVILAWTGRWTPVGGVPKVSYRAVLRVGSAVYAAGDHGTLVRFSDPIARSDATPVDLGTTCTLRALFSRGDAVWVIGSEGGRAAVWRVGSDRSIAGWGACP